MENKKPFNIITRIMSGYAIIILMTFTVTIVGIMIITKNNTNISTEEPLVISLQNFKFLISETEKYTENWIYKPKILEQEALIKIQTQIYPDLKSEMELLATESNDLNEQEEIIKNLAAYDNIINIQQQITKKLASEDDFTDPVKMEAAIAVFDKQFSPSIKSLMNKFTSFSEAKVASLQKELISQKKNNDLLLYILILEALLTLGVSALVFWLTQRIITKPLQQIKETVMALGKGDMVDLGKLKDRNSLLDGYKTDEIGEMVTAIDILNESIKHKTSFAEEIGKGNYIKEFQLLSNKDTLGKSLFEMRDKLVETKVEDEKRIWSTEGLAKFGELLRNGSDNVETLSYSIIYNLVKYLDANQGSIFIVTENDQKKEVLELKACYAWDRRKYLNMKIDLGEGLVGQAWQENETIYLSDFPENYIEITSGLGKANPNNLLIVPLKLNENTYGMIELASFKKFEQYQREFIEKIGESIASTISSVKINSQTKLLLQETQGQSEQMRAQEEEMRQNMEEMKATQEEMSRKELETNKTIAELKFSAEQGAISRTDLNGNITFVNEEFLKWSKFSREELIGKNHNILKSGHHPDNLYAELWNTISNGKVFRAREIKNKAKDGSFFGGETVISPVLDEDGKPKEYIARRYYANN